MTTRITVQVVNDLVSTAQAIQAANRQAQVEKERRARLERKARDLREKAQPEEPKAVLDPLERLTGLLLPLPPYWLGCGGLIFQYDNSEAGGGRLDIRATSGNGLVTATGTTSVWDGADPIGYGRNVVPRDLLDPSKPVPGTPIDNGYRFADAITGEVHEYIMPGNRQTGWAQLIARKTASWFPLPVGKDAAVLIGVAVARYSRSWTRAYRATSSDSFTYTNYGDHTTRHEVVAFLCTYGTAQQIEVPDSFRTLMEAIFPTDERPLVQNPDTDPAVPLLWDPPALPAPQCPTPSANPQNALYSYGATKEITTPAIYSVLNNYATLNAGLDLNPQALVSIRPFLPGIANDLQFVTAAPGTPTRVYRWGAALPALTDNFTNPPAASWAQVAINPKPLDSRPAWWDWNRGDYCLQQAIALGFSAVDILGLT